MGNLTSGELFLPPTQTRSNTSEVPAVAEGYFTTVRKPLDVFRCRFVYLCPGGTPGPCRK